MARSHGRPTSEAVESLNKIYVGFFFCLVFTNGGKALKFLVGDEGMGVQILDWVRTGALIGAIGLLALFFWKSRQIRCADRRVFFGQEFIHYVFNKAMVISWFFTLLMLMFLGELSETEVMFVGEVPALASLPAEFYLTAAVSMMLLVYCIAYFLLYRSEGGSEEK